MFHEDEDEKTILRKMNHQSYGYFVKKTHEMFNKSLVKVILTYSVTYRYIRQYLSLSIDYFIFLNDLKLF